MKKVGVIGCGFMGGGIAQVCAQAGHDVYCFDSSGEAIERCRAGVAKGFDKRIEKGKATEEEKQAVIGRIRYVDTLDQLKDREIVIEAVFESMETKVEMFRKIREFVGEDCIFVSNTSGLCISEIGEKCGRPEKTMGAHFFSPVPVMKLVELIRGEKTSDATYRVVRELVETLKKVIVDAPDAPGFIVNLLLVLIMNEASRMLELGASAEDIDTVLKTAMGMPLGGLGLADLSGLDIAINSTRNIYSGLGVKDFAVPRTLQRLNDFGYLGMKTGRGYFAYNNVK